MDEIEEATFINNALREYEENHYMEEDDEWQKKINSLIDKYYKIAIGE